ncbi:MAG TPA: antitoxin family protein [Anaerolineae bacterium]|nr:antitoxin family protein [Anaerolineae bacterium]
MLEVKGIYRNGRVELLEPVDVPEPQEVTVTFEQPNGEAKEAALSIIGLLSDLSEDEWQQFLQAVRPSDSFFGDRELEW